MSRWVDSEPLQRVFDQRLERARADPQERPGYQKGSALFESCEFSRQRGFGLFLSHRMRVQRLRLRIGRWTGEEPQYLREQGVALLSKTGCRTGCSSALENRV